MATLVLPNVVLTNPADNTEIQDNFNAVVAVVNALDTENLSGGANIDPTQLAARHYEFLVNLRILTTAAGAAPGVSATRPIAVVGLPGNAVADGIEYTVISACWACTNAGTGGGNTTLKVEHGAFTTPITGAWLQIGAQDIVNAFNIVANLDFQQGNCALVNTVLPCAATPTFIGLFLTAIAGDAMNTANDELVVTLKLARTNGLRTI